MRDGSDFSLGWRSGGNGRCLVSAGHVRHAVFGLGHTPYLSFFMLARTSGRRRGKVFT